MNNLDRQYFELLRHILENGRTKGDRTGTGTKSVFDYTIRHKMSEGAAILTSKKVYFKGVLHELLWFLQGNTNIQYLVKNGVHIWDGDAYKNYVKTITDNHEMLSKNPVLDVQPLEILSKDEFINRIENNDEFAKQWGELGPVYGKQWRRWFHGNWWYNGSRPMVMEKHVDQISNLIDDLRNNPDSRRLMVSAWNPGEIDKMVLPPCHYGFQCYTYEMTENERIEYWCNLHNKSLHFGRELDHKKMDELGVPKRKISMKFTMRSIDVFLGLPFNLASYGVLLQILAQEVNMVADELIFSGADCHIYLNHIDQCVKQLTQEVYDLPTVEINKGKSIFDITFSDIKLLNYKSSAPIKGELSN